MKVSNAGTFLRRVLLADAALSSVMALLLVLGAGAVASVTALPELLLYGAGWVLVPWVAFLMFTATREPLRAALVWVVIIVNAAWTVDSVALLFMDSIAPNGLGIAFVLAQTLVVATLAVLQAAGLRARRRAAQA